MRPNNRIDVCNQQIIDTMFLSRADKASACWAIVPQIKPHYYYKKRIACVYDEVDIKRKKSVSNKSIFEAVCQISKYIEYYVKLGFGHFNPAIYADGKEGIISAYFPIIVFDGILYEAQIIPSGINLVKCEATTLLSYRKVDYCDFPLAMYTNIVSKKTFLKVVSEIVNDIKKMERYVKSKSFKKMVKDPFPLIPFIEIKNDEK